MIAGMSIETPRMGLIRLYIRHHCHAASLPGLFGNARNEILKWKKTSKQQTNWQSLTPVSRPHPAVSWLLPILRLAASPH